MRKLDFEDQQDSEAQSFPLLKKAIQKPHINKYSTPPKLLCKKPLSLLHTKSFTPIPEVKIQPQINFFDMKTRSYSSLECNIQEFQRDEIIESEDLKELKRSPHVLMNTKTLAEYLKARPEELIIVDCRYLFEYEGTYILKALRNRYLGGHIKGALGINNDPLQLLDFFFSRGDSTAESLVSLERSTQDLKKIKSLDANSDAFLSPTKEIISRFSQVELSPEEVPKFKKKIVFHCEFSQARGPKMYDLFRNFDRELNFLQYPKLHYPEIFLLEGGYSVFVQDFPVLHFLSFCLIKFIGTLRSFWWVQ